jgi:hybrid polyketide synthase/nonribosomal peptide synthetase ACE1
MLASYATYIQDNPDLNLQDLSCTLYARRSALPIRAAFPAVSAQTLASKIRERLEAAQKDDGKSTLVGVRASSRSPSILGIFTGQGAQWATMVRELVLKSSYVRNLVEDLDTMLQILPESDRPTWSFVDELLADASTSRVGEALIAQPLFTIVQIVLVDLLQATGLKFKAVVGHSSGEFAAAYAAGFLTRSDAVKIAYYRGLCTKFAGQGRQGAMMAVGTSMDDAIELCNLPMFGAALRRGFQFLF